jgi:dTDP-glucose 4,6-dehydratase
VEDHCSAILVVLERGLPGQRYNIGAHCERQNIDVVTMICDYLDKRLGLMDGNPRRELIEYVSDRPGHDRRYAIDASKMKSELHWRPSVTFEQGIEETIEWYLDNMAWVENIETGKYREYK